MSDWHDTPEWRKARTYAKTILEPICAICEKHLEGFDWTIDHILPPLDGKPDHDLSNLQSMCRECNSRKKDRISERVNWANPRW